MRASLLSLLLLAFPVASGEAEPAWRALPGAPAAVRIDDLVFVDAVTGWVATGDGSIYHTTNAGGSWTEQLFDPDLYFRCIRFADAQRGWAGTLNSSHLLYATTNGGKTWTPVTNVPPPRPNAICGMWAPSAQVAYAVGSYAGPARLIKTTDGGSTWSSADLAPLARTLVDVYFVSDLDGLVVGSIGVFPDLSQSVVLHTSDGGSTWQERYVGSRMGEWCWKISFPTPSIGYVSLEKTDSPMFFLKTTDGGLTWSEHPFEDFNEQGIGFATPEVGWIGGASNPTFGTTDGGQTWTATPWGDYLNRFQFLSPTLGYGSGVTVYKYSDEPVGVTNTTLPPKPRLAAAPNPFKPRTTIRYELTEPGAVRLFVADPAGRVVRTLMERTQGAGSYRVEWDGRDDAGRDLPAGIYLYVLHAGNRHDMGKLVRIR